MSEQMYTHQQCLPESVIPVSNTQKTLPCSLDGSIPAADGLKLGLQILLSVLVLAASPFNLSYAETVARNTIELQSTFKGNQEQPKVMYIVPWKKIKAPAAAYQPLDSLIGANFEYLDRDEFRRGIAYRSSIASEKPRNPDQPSK